MITTENKTEYWFFLNLILVVSLFFFSCNKSDKEINGNAILKKSIDYHDPNDIWNTSVFSVHIEEPRTGNPSRYSMVKMNNRTGTFELQRNRGEHISTHIVDEDGKGTALLDGQEIRDSILISKYRLSPDRSIDYQMFYEMMWGLPMSLNNDIISELKKVSITNFNKQESYKIELELKEAMFSKYWNVYIETSNFKLIGVEIIFPDKPNEGERIYFERDIIINTMRIPRIRHWYEYHKDEYSGSDILIKEIQS